MQNAYDLLVCLCRVCFRIINAILNVVNCITGTKMYILNADKLITCLWHNEVQNITFPPLVKYVALGDRGKV